MKSSILFLLAAALFLTGCAISAVKTYSLSPPESPGGRMCSLQCGEALRYCSLSCDLHQRQCVQDVQAQALHDYDKYTVEQFSARQPIELHARDFERLTPCDEAKKDCVADCESNYRLCYENCGGVVVEHSSCQYMCF